jgi:hypothetical protein
MRNKSVRGGGSGSGSQIWTSDGDDNTNDDDHDGTEGRMVEQWRIAADV